MLLSRSVLGKVMSFFVSYIWLVFGFMMAFIILFSNYRNFSEFPGPLVHREYYIYHSPLHPNLGLHPRHDVGGAGVQRSLLPVKYQYSQKSKEYIHLKSNKQYQSQWEYYWVNRTRE